MPYIFVEELQEGQEEAQVVERAEYDGLSQQLEEAREQRDQAISRAESAEQGLREAKEKYANTFLSKPPTRLEPKEKPKLSAQSISELFKIK